MQAEEAGQKQAAAEKKACTAPTLAASDGATTVDGHCMPTSDCAGEKQRSVPSSDGADGCQKEIMDIQCCVVDGPEEDSDANPSNPAIPGTIYTKGT